MTLALARTAIPFALAGLGLLAAKAGDEPPKSTLARAMRAIAEGITMRTPDGRTTFECVGDPIYRFNDPARKFSDGTVWAFGKIGRPAALVTLSLEKKSSGEVQWVHEFTSLASGPVGASNPDHLGAWRWEPSEPGLAMTPIPKAPPPDKDGGSRLRQLRELARRFAAYELWDPNLNARAQRYELRLLPRPVHRYSEPAHGLIDGAIFLIAYGQDPEIALVIEARRVGDAAPAWSYGMGRIAVARLLVRLDGLEVADWPRPASTGPESVYGAIARRARDLED